MNTNLKLSMLLKKRGIVLSSNKFFAYKNGLPELKIQRHDVHEGKKIICLSYEIDDIQKQIYRVSGIWVYARQVKTANGGIHHELPRFAFVYQVQKNGMDLWISDTAENEPTENPDVALHNGLISVCEMNDLIQLK